MLKIIVTGPESSGKTTLCKELSKNFKIPFTKEFAREYLQEKWNKENDLDDEVVLIGGGTVFEESILIVNKLVLTRVDCEIIGDIFYPDIDLTDWTMISEESHAKDADNEYNFKIETYLKN